MPPAFTFRPMTAVDIAAAHALSLAVGWPHRREDWQLLLSLGEGIVAAQGNRVVATAMWWLLDAHAARVGMVIVDPSRQRAGFGRMLMQRSLAAVGARTVSLTATREGAGLYERLGFVPAGGVCQHQGVASAVPPPGLGTAHRIVRPIVPDLDTLIDLDRRATGVARAPVLAALAPVAGTAVLLDGHTPAGFAMCRSFGRGQVIGPVVARNRAEAEALTAHWIADKPGQFLRIDVPAGCGLSPFLTANGIAQVDEATAMRRGDPPVSGGPWRCFAIVSQALG
jgi:predicted N-acetyltransferase YhbS